MKKIVTVLLLAIGFAMGMFSAEKQEWLTDFNRAQAEARKSGKVMFVNFTGSDWCRWCILLHKNILSTPTFLQYARKNLILVKIDFPSQNVWQTPAEKRANARLAQKYGVSGYPTVLLMDASGNVLGRTGYRDGTPEEYVRHLQKILKNKGRK